MSDWIKRRGEEYLQKKQEKEHKEQLINTSNYWLKLRKQIETDIAFLNTESVYAGKLEHKIGISEAENGYKIVKTQLPLAVFITVANKGDEIEISYEIFKHSNDKYPRRNKEQLQVCSDGENVFLNAKDEMLLVPEQAAEYILKPIVDTLEADI